MGKLRLKLSRIKNYYKYKNLIKQNFDSSISSKDGILIVVHEAWFGGVNIIT